MGKSKKQREMEVSDAVNRLREQIKPGDTLHFVCTYHSRRWSTHGYKVLMAVIDEHIEDGTDIETRTVQRARIRDVTYLVGKATGTWRQSAQEIRVKGWGVDKRFYVVDRLCARLGGPFVANGLIYNGS